MMNGRRDEERRRLGREGEWGDGSRREKRMVAMAKKRREDEQKKMSRIFAVMLRLGAAYVMAQVTGGGSSMIRAG